MLSLCLILVPRRYVADGRITPCIPKLGTGWRGAARFKFRPLFDPKERASGNHWIAYWVIWTLWRGEKFLVLKGTLVLRPFSL
jgi:hypothetical protein